jgi:phosphoribosyl 1,2-cyclic phosphodiesterase
MMKRNRPAFFCLSSGSVSNCFYLGYKDYGILIDAGLGIRKTLQLLQEHDIAIESIKAILITHDHIDHVKAVASLGERRGIPVYATKQTVEGINCRECITPKLELCVRYINKESPITLGAFEVVAFALPHDAEDSVGYRVKVEDISFVFMTDLGHLPATALPYIREATHLVIEANHDIAMLKKNPNYAESLKERISSNHGHLGNHQTASYIEQYVSDTISHIWLCHLSKENNDPAIALREVMKALTKRSLNNVKLEVLHHGIQSDYIYL